MVTLFGTLAAPGIGVKVLGVRDALPVYCAMSAGIRACAQSFSGPKDNWAET